MTTTTTTTISTSNLAFDMACEGSSEKFYLCRKAVPLLTTYEETRHEGSERREGEAEIERGGGELAAAAGMDHQV